MNDRNNKSMTYILTISNNVKDYCRKLLVKEANITKEDILELSKMLSGFNIHTFRIGTVIDDLENEIKEISKALRIAETRIIGLSKLVRQENQGTKH